MCSTGSLAYPAVLADGSPSVLNGGCAHQDEYRHCVWLSEAILADDGFDDGVYIHTGAPMPTDTPPVLKLKDLKGFVPPAEEEEEEESSNSSSSSGGGGISLEDAISSLRATYAGHNLVIHGLHGLVADPDPGVKAPAHDALAAMGGGVNKQHSSTCEG